MTNMASILKFTTVIILIIFAAIIALQIFLSTRENKWLGRILPIISFVSSLLLTVSVVLSFCLFTASGPDDMAGSLLGLIWAGVISLIVTNIPTAILLLIYLGCRATRKKKLGNNVELNKMSIQDL